MREPPERLPSYPVFAIDDCNAVELTRSYVRALRVYKDGHGWRRWGRGRIRAGEHHVCDTFPRRREGPRRRGWRPRPATLYPAPPPVAKAARRGARVWHCDSCGHEEPAQLDYAVGDSEACVHCKIGLAMVTRRGSA